MSSTVFFTRTSPNCTAAEVQQKTKQLLEALIKKEDIQLEKKIPLKVHFGEKGNKTFIKAENYQGIIDFLQKQDVEPSYIETSVLYGGQRNTAKLHLKHAHNHGFTQLPIIFADGEQGEAFSEIDVQLKHFKTCKIGERFSDYKQVIVLSHFKGHGMAGFGGAIKQLSMGCASKGGKLAMHMGSKPKIKARKCTQCHACEKRCNVDALQIGQKSYIDHKKCVGCGVCVPACPTKAISMFTLKGITNALTQSSVFKEKIVEYAYAAQLGKQNIYINFAMNITRGCDCEPRKMKSIIPDLGLFISTDPVAIDKACHDIAKENGKKFKGVQQLTYGETIGLGSQNYKLIEVYASPQ
jgi:uncharacterized Fe-S center protein